MVKDAEQHRDEDRRLRELTEARNQLDSMAYQVERVLSERADSLPVHEKARAENAVTEARQALNDQAPLDRLRTLTDELQQIYQILAAPPQGPAPEPETELPRDDDDVIDAEFTTRE
jgi:molecular chaperone DnaK